MTKPLSFPALDVLAAGAAKAKATSV